MRIIFDDGIDKNKCYNIKPYYQLRGKPVSKEQAFQIIRLTDTYFYDLMWLKNVPLKGCIESVNFKQHWFDINHIPSGFGWCHPDGVIGINNHTDKYPSITDIINEWSVYLERFPFLDIVIALTDCDMETPWMLDEYYKQSIELERVNRKYRKISDLESITSKIIRTGFKYQEVKDFELYMDIGFHIHDNTISVLNRKNALKLYTEYKKYECADIRRYTISYSEDFNVAGISDDILKKYLAAYELPKGIIEEMIRKSYTKNYHENP